MKLTTEGMKNWGTLNGLTGKKYKEWRAAKMRHDQEIVDHPEEHEMSERERGRCYYETYCTCGFRYSIDTSD